MLIEYIYIYIDLFILIILPVKNYTFAPSEDSARVQSHPSCALPLTNVTTDVSYRYYNDIVSVLELFLAPGT